MYVIGECLNGMYMNVRTAINERNKEVIHELARGQIEAGANALDLNVGPAKGDKSENMLWLAETTREVTDAELWIDTPKWEVIENTIPKLKGPVAINSTKGDDDALEKYMDLALVNDAGLIALTMDKDGVPSDVNRRVEIGAQILAKAAEKAFPHEKLYVDPIILPVNAAPDQPPAVIGALQQLVMFSDPAPKLILGLSNVSQKCNHCHLINRVYLTMALTAGLTAAIMDPFDKELMDAAITVELMQNKAIYCDGFLEAYRMAQQR
jgi:5-methyltetrahydrofolate corrinoid/iron sulfur protein methyltransferase